MAVNSPAWVPTYDSGGGQVSGHILRGSRVGHGAFLVSGAMRTTDFVTNVTGWSINADGSVEFNSGNFRGDITGATGTFSGAVSGGTIDIGGADATSFHVDATGNMWLGHANYASAPFKVSAAGALAATSASFSGSVASGGGVYMPASGQTIEFRHGIYPSANSENAEITFDATSVQGRLRIYGVEFTGNTRPYIELNADDGNGSIGNSIGIMGQDLLVDKNTYFNGNIGKGSSVGAYGGTLSCISNFAITGALTATGSIRANTGGVDGGLIMRPWLASADYMSLGTNGMTSTEYCLLSNGLHTYISAAVGGSTYIRGGNNSTTYQIEVSALGIGVTGKLNLTPIDATNEGGELVFEGAGAYPDMNLDMYQHQFRFLRGGSTVDMLIDSAGNAYNRGGTWGTISDPRIKENIRPADARRAQIRALDVVDYELIDRSGTHRGVDASAARLVFPELVETLDDKEYPEGLLAVKTSQLTWELLLLVQELETRVEILEAA